ncbi:hypothetical protein [Frigoriglobus tundricola]|uniref:hypothetical protein n=1 Tax=Frigoriglobus tundricola TaxID=2774151 RepID=UPI00148E90CF|nr:hypothetical protein [Frigoriglobus tundricola]
MCDLMVNLRVKEQDMKDPAFPPDAFDLVAAYLDFVLTDLHAGLIPHGRFVERLFGGTAPESSPLTEPQALAFIERGLEVCRDVTLFPCGADVTLARLLFNVPALRDLFDLIAHLLPDYWLPLLEKHGRRAAEAAGVDLSGPTAPRTRRTRLVAAFRPFADDPITKILLVRFDGPDGASAQNLIAGRAIGDPEAEFVLRIHWRDGRGTLELCRAPQQEVRIRVLYPSGEQQEVALPVAEGWAQSSTAELNPVAPLTPASVPGEAAFEWHDDACALVLRTKSFHTDRSGNSR